MGIQKWRGLRPCRGLGHPPGAGSSRMAGLEIYCCHCFGLALCGRPLWLSFVAVLCGGPLHLALYAAWPRIYAENPFVPAQRCYCAVIPADLINARQRCTSLFQIQNGANSAGPRASTLKPSERVFINFSESATFNKC